MGIRAFLFFFTALASGADYQDTLKFSRGKHFSKMYVLQGATSVVISNPRGNIHLQGANGDTLRLVFDWRGEAVVSPQMKLSRSAGSVELVIEFPTDAQDSVDLVVQVPKDLLQDALLFGPNPQVSDFPNHTTVPDSTSACLLFVEPRS